MFLLGAIHVFFSPLRLSFLTSLQVKQINSRLLPTLLVEVPHVCRSLDVVGRTQVRKQEQTSNNDY